MTKVVVLHSAEDDLRELRSDIVERFGKLAWQRSRARLEECFRRIADHPDTGRIPPELAALDLLQYRQIISGMNRILYEVRGDIAYVHLICDTRRDLRTLLMRRILRST